VTSQRAVLVYDGDCGVCTGLAYFAQRRLRPDARITAWQDADLRALRLTAAQCEAALQWVGPTGRISSAEDAVARMLLVSVWWARPLGLLLLAPGVRAVAGSMYHRISANRGRLPGSTPASELPPAQRPGSG
jgi:predicted DCC family thiol-disulfide oxidoreductase YuxK